MQETINYRKNRIKENVWLMYGICEIRKRVRERRKQKYEKREVKEEEPESMG